jgi:hypothetical protein
MMRLIQASIILAALAAFLPAQTAPAAKTAKKPQVAASRPVAKVAEPKRHPDGRPLGVPYDAVKIAPAAWRTTENGKPVVYRQTAFGYSKLTDEENAKIQRMIDGKPDPSTDVPQGISVVEKEGKLHFSRITPFGPYHWVKEKTDLNPVESAVWSKAQKAAPKTAEVRN